MCCAFHCELGKNLHDYVVSIYLQLALENPMEKKANKDYSYKDSSISSLVEKGQG
jgi:hypothetical protein